MTIYADYTSTPSRLDAAQGASEARTELYLNTAKEYCSWQRYDAPRAVGVTGCAGWQDGVAEVWGE